MQSETQIQNVFSVWVKSGRYPKTWVWGNTLKDEYENRLREIITDQFQGVYSLLNLDHATSMLVDADAQAKADQSRVATETAALAKEAEAWAIAHPLFADTPKNRDHMTEVCSKMGVFTIAGWDEYYNAHTDEFEHLAQPAPERSNTGSASDLLASLGVQPTRHQSHSDQQEELSKKASHDAEIIRKDLVKDPRLIQSAKAAAEQLASSFAVNSKVAARIDWAETNRARAELQNLVVYEPGTQNIDWLGTRELRAKYVREHGN